MWLFFVLINSLLAFVYAQLPDSNAWISSGPDSASASYCGATGNCLNQTVPKFAKGTVSVFYMQVITSNSADPTKNKIYTAAFYPRVDEYAELVVPMATGQWMQQLTDASTSVRVQMVMLIDNQLFKSGTIAFTGIEMSVVCVPARTLVINLNNGKPFLNGGMTWSKTSCALNACACIENICASDCNSPNMVLTVRIGWSGTDANGAALSSLGSDIWHFQNAV
ncbi:hypothetical protein BDR26DRAFT_866101 [Obelidium mucronatum]|nr:hypothetical protein BDR26DRAFT_866101 [Obelidium mucronatum]